MDHFEKQTGISILKMDKILIPIINIKIKYN